MNCLATIIDSLREDLERLNYVFALQPAPFAIPTTAFTLSYLESLKHAASPH